MLELRAQRLAAVAGIAAVLLVIAEVILSPDYGDPASSTTQIMQLSAKSHDGILAFMLLSGFSSLFLLWFVGGLVSTLRQEGNVSSLSLVALGGGIIFVTVDLLEKSIVAALTYRVAHETSPATVRAMFDLHLMTMTLAQLPLAALVLASGLAILSTHGMPRGTGYLALLAGALLIVGSGGLLDPQGALAAVSPIGMILTLAWILTTSILIIRRSLVARPEVTTARHTVDTPAPSMT